MDISDAFVRDTGYVAVENERAIVWSANFEIRPELLPVAFDSESDHVAVLAEVLVGGAWESYQLGLYTLDEIRETVLPNGQEVWTVQAADVSLHLWETYTEESYSIAAGDVFTDLASDLIVATGLRADVYPSPSVAAAARTWPSNTPHGRIVADIFAAINYHPPYADNEGMVLGRPRVAPSTAVADVAYTTEAEPRMIRPGLTRTRNRNLYQNRLTVVNRDSNRAPFAVVGLNDDPDSLVSTVVKGAVTGGELDGSMVPTLAVAAAIAVYELQEKAGDAEMASLTTHPDPRRGAREFYDVTVEAEEVATLWRNVGWRLSLRTGAAMEHSIARARQVDVTTTHVGGGVVEPTIREDGAVTGGHVTGPDGEIIDAGSIIV